MKSSLIVTIGLSSLVMSLHSDAATRLDRMMWTDRSVTNPPLSESTSSINHSIDRFWNLPEHDLPTAPTIETHTIAPKNRYHSRHQHHQTIIQNPRPRLVQKQNQSEKRGYFGINLFNMIPLIDIVHGSSESNSSDHVEIIK